MTKKFLGILLTGLAAASLATAADKAKAAANPAPDEKAQMEAMMRASTPGENHKKLEAFVGTFDAKVRMWDKPGAPPTDSPARPIPREPGRKDDRARRTVSAPELQETPENGGLYGDRTDSLDAFAKDSDHR